MREVEQALKDLGNIKPSEARVLLLRKGFSEDEVQSVLKHKNPANKLLSAKETLDRIGYGFATPQIINILFQQSGASLFLIGIINGLKAILSLILSSIIQEYGQKHTIHKKHIGTGGVLFGFSFFILAFATLAKIPWLFSTGFILGALGVVTHGDLYHKLVNASIKHEHKNHYLRNITHYGIIITAIALLGSTWLIDNLNQKVTLGNAVFKVDGFLMSFMITAFAFIISGYLLSLIPDKREQLKHPFKAFFREHTKMLKKYCMIFLHHKYIILLLFATTLSSILNILGNSFYGIFIYDRLKDVGLGGFMNIGVIYGIALIISLIGPFFTKRFSQNIGLTPHLVFGTLLTAILPLILAFNPHYLAIIVALVLSILGGGIIGVAQGLLARKVMDEHSRKIFYPTQAIMVIIPYLIFIPLGSWLVNTHGFKTLFITIVIGLVVVVMPLYFLLVTLTNKKGL